LTPELRASVEAAKSKPRLENLSVPQKPWWRTKAQIARGEPRWAGGRASRGSTADPETEVARDLNPAFTSEPGENPVVPNAKPALEGTRQVVMEQFAEDALQLGVLCEYLRGIAWWFAKIESGQEKAPREGSPRL
jgi:uncharacterized protein